MNLRSYYWDMGTGDKRISLLSFDFHETVVADIKYTCTRKWWSLLNISKNGTIDALSETNVDNAGYGYNVGNYWKLLTILTTVLMTRLTTILTYCWHNVDDKVDDDVDNNFDYSVDDNVDHNFDDDVDNNVENVDIVLWPCWGNLTHIMITKARWSPHKLLSSWLQRQAWFNIKMIIMITKASIVPHHARVGLAWQPKFLSKGLVWPWRSCF